MYCKACGAKNDENQIRCSRCGAPLMSMQTSFSKRQTVVTAQREEHNQQEAKEVALAVADVLKTMGSGILKRPNRLVASLMDEVDPENRIGAALVNNCDHELLEPYERALGTGSKEALETTLAMGSSFLQDDRSLREDVAAMVSWSLVAGIADFLGIEVPVLPERTARSAQAAPKTAAAEPSSKPTESSMQSLSRPQPVPTSNVRPQHLPQTSPRVMPTSNVPQTRRPVSATAPMPRPTYAQSGATDSRSCGRELAIFGMAFCIVLIIAISCFMIFDPLNLYHGGAGSSTNEATESTATTSEASESLGEVVTPEVKDGLSSYSWTELAQIATYIENTCSSRADALAAAKEYNLVSKSNGMLEDVVSVGLDDGKVLECQLIDVLHDDANTASGVAAFTFMTTNIVMLSQMSHGTTSPGGWEASIVRSWLNGEVLESFPEELRSGIVEAYKYSNNEGYSRSTTCVTRTNDLLWVPSIVELTGEVNWDYTTDNGANDTYYNAVFNAEGDQYAYFKEAGVKDEDANAVLTLSGYPWWTRSTAASTGRGRYVSSAGEPDSFGDSNQTLGVTPCFCL